jgi:hypothetical protein
VYSLFFATDRRLLRFEDPLYKMLLMTPCPSAIDASVEVGRRLDILVPKQLLDISKPPGAASSMTLALT